MGIIIVIIINISIIGINIAIGIIIIIDIGVIINNSRPYLRRSRNSKAHKIGRPFLWKIK